jgi:hypothetical protein
MMTLFGIGEAEAIGRINRHWQGQEILTELQVANLSHDHHDSYLAKTVWYGRESFWWVKDESVLSPLPWPCAPQDRRAGTCGEVVGGRYGALTIRESRGAWRHSSAAEPVNGRTSSDAFR